jgi:hypothetical protein
MNISISSLKALFQHCPTTQPLDFCIVQHVPIFSTNFWQKDWNWLWLCTWYWMKFITNTRTIITCSRSKVFPNSACWWMMQWSSTYNLGFYFPISHIIASIKLAFLTVILGVPSVFTPYSFIQGSSSSIMVSHTFKNKSSPVDEPCKPLRLARYLTISKDCYVYNDN